MVTTNERKLQRLNARVAFYYKEKGTTWRGNQDVETTALVIVPNEKGKRVFKGRTVCSLKDNFRRKTGRDKALGRAISNFENDVEPTLNKFEEKIINSIKL